MLKVATINKVIGVRKVVSFFNYIAFDGPEVVRLAGVGLMLMIGLTHMYAFPEHFHVAVYLGLSFAALFAGTLAAAFGVMRGRKWGWKLGTALCIIAIVAYILSRLFGFPDFPAARGAWDTPSGTIAVAFELTFIAIYLAIVTGIAVAYPDRQGWHD